MSEFAPAHDLSFSSDNEAKIAPVIDIATGQEVGQQNPWADPRLVKLATGFGSLQQAAKPLREFLMQPQPRVRSLRAETELLPACEAPRHQKYS